MSYNRKRIKSRKDLNSRNKQGRRFLLLLLLFLILFIFTCKLSHISEEDFEQKKIKIAKQQEEQVEEIDINTLSSREQVKVFASKYGIPEELLRFRKRNNNIVTQIPVNRERYDLYFTNYSISKFFTSLNWIFVSGVENTAATLQTLVYQSPKDSLNYRFIIYYDKAGSYAQQKPKVSVIIKGFGSLTDKEITRWQNLNTEFCYSIIPDKTHSIRNMELLVNSNHETLLELPLEPANYPISFPGKNAIFVQYNEDQIKDKMDYFFNQMPAVMGVITYMGSLVVTDQAVMINILNELKVKGLYFIDDLPIATSIAYNTAQRLLVTSYEKTGSFDAKRFLKNKTKKDLKDEFLGFKKSPIIITINNPDDFTYEFIQILEEIIFNLGYEIVRVSEL
ncbi:MAG: divergent polysaccharide deacetylase family protein [Candidatus Cloacimonetes bacterium]|nr:divergent polysaccharide deacetylase family protein [Candidatus Cloacimonadota bacterium]